MALRIAVLKERAPGENRVALTPETAKKFARSRCCRCGRGRRGSACRRHRRGLSRSGRRSRPGRRRDQGCGHRDRRAGAGRRPACGREAGCLGRRDLRSVSRRERVEAYAKAGLEALSMEFMPRITRAQSMDVLSSQSNLAGYKAVLTAANDLWPRLSDDDDRCRHGAGGQGLRDGRGRGRPAGDRDRQAAGRAGLGHRRALGDQGTDPVARRESRSSSRMSPGSRAKARAAMPPR